MFNENLKTLRKQKGMSQEALAIELNVVRQTVSKWEKGLSVPDVEMLQKIADTLDAPISTLLGAKIVDEESTNDQAEQLARIAEQMAVKNRRAKRIWKIVLIIIILSVAISAVITILGFLSYSFIATTNSEVEKQAEEMLTTEPVSMFISNILS